jgi:hypothetical protein
VFEELSPRSRPACGVGDHDRRFLFGKAELPQDSQRLFAGFGALHAESLRILAPQVTRRCVRNSGVIVDRKERWLARYLLDVSQPPNSLGRALVGFCVGSCGLVPCHAGYAAAV